MTKPPEVEELRDQLDQFAPTDANIDYIAKQVQTHIDANSERPSPAHEHTSRVARRRRPRLALGAVAAAAAVIALVIAFGPGGSTSQRDSGSGFDAFVGPDTAAARELVRVGDAAAKKPWRALGSGEYFHLYASTIPGDESSSAGRNSYEVWLDDEGHGQVLNVMGSADPSRIPTISPGGGIGMSTRPPKGRTVTLEESLATPNSVNLMGWPEGGEAFQRSWARQQSGYVSTYDSDDKPDRPSGVSDFGPEQTMQQFWSITADRIDDLPTEGGAEMDRAIGDLLDEYLDDSPMRSNRIANGAWGVTREQLDREEKIQFTVNILASAPLPPEARQSLFRWLATQPGASLKRDATDAIGRPGIQISFEHKFHERIPARTATVQDLIDEAIAGGAKLNPDVRVTFMDFPKTAAEMERRQHEELEKTLPRDHTYRIPAHNQERTWTVEMVIDPNTGELLQQRIHMIKRASAAIPELIRHKDRVQIHESAGPGGSEQMSGSSLYYARDIARLDEPRSPICDSQPELCLP